MKQSHAATYQTTVAQARAHRALKSRVSYFLRDYDLTMMQWSIIGLVSESGEKGVRISDLAHDLDTSLAFITTTINVLEGKGMVIRSHHASDNRAKLVHLSESFRPRVAEIETELSKKLYDWLSASTDAADLATYVKVLSQIASVDSRAQAEA